jgi:amino acid transporter
MGAVTALGFVIGQLTSLSVLIQLLTVVTVLVQALAQILALVVLRRRQPDLRRPYRMWLYPVPALVAALGWIVIYGYADANAPGLHPIELSLLWVAVGAGAFALWARSKGVWPFGPRQIEERYRDADPLALELDEEDVAVAARR